MTTAYIPDLLYTEGAFHPGLMLEVGEDGSILRIAPAVDAAAVREGYAVVLMPNRAMMPGLVNGHSHTFQRLIRGVAEHSGPNGDDFWAWRNTMYRAASQLDPDDLFDVARMAFLEMALCGITTVGEFHYVHRHKDGSAYQDPNLLSKRVIDAASSVGLRICLLRVAYERAGFDLPPNPGQRRFYESCDEYLANVERLASDLRGVAPTVTMGVAPHSIRAVPLESVKKIAAWAEERRLPIHMHMAEQTAELAACEREHGAPPIRLMAAQGLLSERWTMVHAIHTGQDEVSAMAAAGVTICSCPTTERNLGDGIIEAKDAIAAGVQFSFGSDSQATINLLEDARELDYHLRLKHQRRVLLDGIDGVEMSARLFGYATAGGARSLGVNVGMLKPGLAADFFTVDLDDVAIAGTSAHELLPMIVFSLDRSAVRDVVVNGRVIVADRQHAQTNEIVTAYRDLALRVGSAVE